MITLNNQRQSLTRKFICIAMAMIVLSVMISATTVFATDAPETTEVVYDNSEVLETENADEPEAEAEADGSDDSATAGEAIVNFLKQTGFYMMFAGGNWKCIVMILISFVLMYLAIVKKFEPLLLLPIAFGMLLTNIPGAEMFHEEFFAGGHVNWDIFSGAEFIETVNLVNPTLYQVLEDGTVVLNGTSILGHLSAISIDTNALIDAAGRLISTEGEVIAESAKVVIDAAGLTVENGNLLAGTTVLATGVHSVTAGLIDYLYLGVKLGIYPCLIFIGVGAMTDFGPLIANPKSLLLGAAAQLGIFVTFAAARLSGFFTGAEAASIGIIGGADGPTAIFVTSLLAPDLLGPIAVAAYSYMALVPVIQPPIMKLLTTKEERMIVMSSLRPVSKREKIIFPFVVVVFVSLLVPSAAPLVAALMLGNLMKESGVVDRLSNTVQNELMNIVTIFLGISVGATATASTFLSVRTILIIVMGVVAFGMGTAGGVLLAKFMNLFMKDKINPLIGSAGVSAVPMAARVSQMVGQKENPSNFLLMHAMGPNVAGVIGSAIAAGVLIALFG
ncbi:MAG: sodium ion-translocating decarboxylase subunit beta [Clostridia bacterium]|nr:sodium ion-translocating decarboxylase subunit beta [Clostridia bacterium]